jgi:putative transposase
LAEWAQAVHALSQRRVARLIPIERMTLRYLHHRDPQEALRVRLRELAGSRVRYGYRRLTVLLKREGWQVNAKRIYRLYLEEGLIVRTQKRRERAQRQRVPVGQAAHFPKSGLILQRYNLVVGTLTDERVESAFTICSPSRP